MLRGIFICFFIGFFLLCSCRTERDYEKHIFIPEGYEGPVMIQYGMKSSKNKMIKVGDKAFFIFITGNPWDFKLYDDALPSGYYTVHNYYYSKDTLYEINTNGMEPVLKANYPSTSNHATLGARNTGLSSYFWVDRDENTAKKEDSIKSDIERKLEMLRK